jgi:hypothetical protein
LRTLDPRGPAGAISEAEFGSAAESGDGGVRSVNGNADLLVRLGTGNGTRRGICVVDFAGPERGHEQDEGGTEEDKKEPE